MNNIFTLFFQSVLGKSQNKIAHLIRYLISGGGVFILDFSVFLLLFEWFEFSAAMANIISKGIGASTGYVLHSYYTFSWKKNKNTKRAAFDYALLTLTNVIISTLLLFLLIDIQHWSPVTWKILVDIFVILVAFFVARYFIFRKEL
ncbi:hypothetical protein CMT41_18055 [Colwellia sp. MT41]|uniref:GtrA family protein n=1 Tax=Colwellia sp. MT41 TaxID=58049 RepID=UPI0007177BBD|nr:GtrA family protein [Colwellia sp. MT41]ALO36433.1 hypothetical protein CMT41_18055 [Colwellia sp. MT41]